MDINKLFEIGDTDGKIASVQRMWKFRQNASPCTHKDSSPCQKKPVPSP